jgi:hypothetical protein
LAYNNLSKINNFSRSDIYQLFGIQIAGRNALHNLADYSARAVMKSSSFQISKFKFSICKTPASYWTFV